MFPTCHRGRVPRQSTRSSLGGSGGDAEFAWRALVRLGSPLNTGACSPRVSTSAQVWVLWTVRLAAGGCGWCLPAELGTYFGS
eukprot:6493349-Pyramimonas_sp.AAC.1